MHWEHSCLYPCALARGSADGLPGCRIWAWDFIRFLFFLPPSFLFSLGLAFKTIHILKLTWDSCYQTFVLRTKLWLNQNQISFLQASPPAPWCPLMCPLRRAFGALRGPELPRHRWSRPEFHLHCCTGIIVSKTLHCHHCPSSRVDCWSRM